MTEIEIASERENTSRGGGRGRSRLIAEEPDVGLYTTTPGSRPEPKANAYRCATQVPQDHSFLIQSSVEGHLGSKIYKELLKLNTRETNKS